MEKECSPLCDQITKDAAFTGSGSAHAVPCVCMRARVAMDRPQKDRENKCDGAGGMLGLTRIGL